MFSRGRLLLGRGRCQASAALSPPAPSLKVGLVSARPSLTRLELGCCHFQEDWPMNRAGPVRSACWVDPWDMGALGSNPPVATQGTGGKALREPGPGFGLGSAATSRVEPCTAVF